MNYFNTQNTGNITFVPIEQIELDYVMVNTLKIYNFNNLDKFIQKTRYSIVGEKLNRIESIFNNMSNNQTFPPIHLVIHKTGGITTYVPPALRKDIKSKKIPLKICYSITDGRHRVISSILTNYSHIPAIIK